MTSERPKDAKRSDLTAGIPETTLIDGVPSLGEVDGQAVIVVRHGDEISAIGATCTHYGAPLGEGLVDGDTIRCSWHHACFSLRTGEALRAPALNPVESYEVVRRDGSVFVARRRTPPRSARRRPSSWTPVSSVAIVGMGAAGNSAAEELRHLAFDRDITVIDRDAQAPYDRPNLSKDYLAGTAPEDWLPLHPAAHYETLRIERLSGRTVTDLDPVTRGLRFEDGTRRQFDAIVLATGAVPVRLAVAGAAGPPIHYVRTLDDSRALIKATESGRRAVVIGAGFIGLEVAASLRARNLEVTVVAPSRRPLERILGPEFGDFIRGLHEQHGVVFHLGRSVMSLVPGGVALDDGRRLSADFVVAGIGVRPDTALAEQANLEVDNGIVVNTFLETAATGVFAVGDVARWPQRPKGELVRIEHWVVAQRQGQAVARNIVGDRAPFTDVPFFWSQHYDVTINYVGHAARWDAIETDGSLEARHCSVRYLEGGELRAMASISRDRESLEAELVLERRAA